MTTSPLSNPTIRQLFSGEIDRKIEEVIKVDQNDVAIVRQEIEDYILTESIERNMLKVLEGYRQSVNQPSDAIAIWVAGFFGAGKSSFAKYVGLAVSNKDLGGESAGDLLGRRANNQAIKALLGAIKEQIPTEAIIFDVSADRNVNANDALTKIFYRKLLDHLGYSSSLEVAELEIELEEQGRMEAFLGAFAELYPAMTGPSQNAPDSGDAKGQCGDARPRTADLCRERQLAQECS